MKSNLESMVGGLVSPFRSVIRPYLMALPLLAGSMGYVGCGDEEPPKPSQYCCEAQKCDEKEDFQWYGYKQVCDGEGDDCYCRPKSCCERRACESSGMNCVPGYEGCECADPPMR